VKEEPSDHEPIGRISVARITAGSTYYKASLELIGA